MIKGVIFDFNGTLYKDHDLNILAWSKAYDSVATEDKKGTYEEFCKGREGLINDYQRSEAILKMFNKPISEEIIYKFGDDKEIDYRNEVVKQNRNELTKGFSELMDYLVKNNIKYCIASMAPLSNFKFYLDYLHLNKWFNLEDNIIYDDFNYTNKNDMYLDAAKKMGLNIEDCLLVEDTPTVIIKSLDIGVKNVLYVNSWDKELKLKEIKQEIKDFKEIDYNIFK